MATRSTSRVQRFSCAHDVQDPVERWRSGLVTAFQMQSVAKFDVLRTSMEFEPFTRKPRGPWFRKPLEENVRKELECLYTDCERALRYLFSSIGPPTQTNFTWRPTVTSGEMHFDKGTPERSGEERIITAFVNVDTEPRVWKLEGGEDVEWAEGEMWIFRAEKVKHQVVHGRCAAQYNWVLL